MDATQTTPDNWHDLPHTITVGEYPTRKRVVAWSDVCLYGPARTEHAEMRVKVTCEDCDGSGIIEEEYAMSSASIEPSYRHHECEHCDGDGVYASEVYGEDGDHLWAILIAGGHMDDKTRRAAVMAAAAHQAEMDEQERNYFEREAMTVVGSAASKAELAQAAEDIRAKHNAEAAQ